MSRDQQERTPAEWCALINELTRSRRHDVYYVRPGDVDLPTLYRVSGARIRRGHLQVRTIEGWFSASGNQIEWSGAMPIRPPSVVRQADHEQLKSQ